MPVAVTNSCPVGFVMPPSTHIVESGAIANLHSLSKAQFYPLRHTVDMDKNNGPNHLKAWREFRKISQEELGERVGTTGSTISMLELGERGLSAKWLRKLAPALNTTPGHLLDHDPSKLDNDIIDIWVNIAPADRAQALRVLRSFRTGSAA